MAPSSLQLEGGPIGLELSGALARVFMLAWDRRLLTALDRAARGLAWDLYMMPAGTRLVRLTS